MIPARQAATSRTHRHSRRCGWRRFAPASSAKPRLLSTQRMTQKSKNLRPPMFMALWMASVCSRPSSPFGLEGDRSSEEARMWAVGYRSKYSVGSVRAGEWGWRAMGQATGSCLGGSKAGLWAVGWRSKYSVGSGKMRSAKQELGWLRQRWGVGGGAALATLGDTCGKQVGDKGQATGSCLGGSRARWWAVRWRLKYLVGSGRRQSGTGLGCCNQSSRWATGLQ